MVKTKKLLTLLVSISLVVMLLFVWACCETTPTEPTTPTTPSEPTTPAEPEPITLVFSEFEMGGSYWDYEVAQPWFAELEKRTNGQVQVEQHWGGEIVGLLDAYDAVLKGTFDFGKILPTMFADKFPMDGVTIFPPTNITCHRPSMAWLELYDMFPEMQASYEATPLLGFAVMPCSGIGTVEGKPIYKWEDAQGLKMPGAGPAPESRQAAVGIIPISVNPGDTYMALKTGTLDGMAMGIYSIKDFGMGDVIATVTMVNINGGPWAYVMNGDTFNSLPDDIQKVLVDMRPWVSELDDQVQAKMHNLALQTFPEEYGTEFIYLSPEELDRWAEVDGPTLDAYLETEVASRGLPADELKTEFLRVMEKYAADEYAYTFD